MYRCLPPLLGVSLITVLTLAGVTTASRIPPSARPAAPAVRQRAVAAYARMPLTFEANRGQTDSQVQFLSRGSGGTLFLTGTEAVLSLAHHGDTETRREKKYEGSRWATDGRRPGDAPATRHKPHARRHSPQATSAVLKMRLVNANPRPKATGVAPLPCKVIYFIGNDPKKWHMDVPQYEQVKYTGVYPGIDLLYYGNRSQLEYDLIVAPGADPGQIRLAYAGAEKLEIDGGGDLLLHVGESTVRQHRPVAYQEIDGRRRTVAAHYVLGSDSPRAESPARSPLRTSASSAVALSLGTYDRSRALVIDPVLAYSTYLGGNDEDAGYGIAVDGAGNAYVTGFTNSTDFPTLGAVQGDQSGIDAFVTKLDTNATGAASVLYAIYLGGNDEDRGWGMAVDAVGNAYVTGETNSTDFPALGAFQGDQVRSDAFVTKLDTNATGAASLLYSTYLGGNENDYGFDIAVDASGDVYLTGSTWSGNFPTLGAFQEDQGSQANDSFVTRLDTNATGAASLLYSTYLGGREYESAYGIAVDGAGNAYVTGYTNSTNFPTLGAFQGYQGDQSGSDSFVTRLDTNASGPASLLYSTCLGGNSHDVGLGIAVDEAENVYVTGYTNSTNFPTLGAFQEDQSGRDAFVTRLDTTATGAASVLYSTCLGGNDEDTGWGIAADGAGNAYATGWTRSTDFPTLGAVQGDQSGIDAFVTKLDTNASGGASLLYSTYLGGNDTDFAFGIAVDGAGNAYVTGETNSTDFPTPGAFQGDQGASDAFVTKILPMPPPLELSSAAYSALESGGSVVITVNRTSGTAPPATVSYATSDGTALAGLDYTATSGVLTFAAGEVSKNVTVPIADDTNLEGGETFTFTLRDPVGTGLGSPSAATVTVTDNLAAPAPSNLSLSVQTTTRILVKWLDNCSNEGGFELQTSTDAGATWTAPTSVAAAGGIGTVIGYSKSGVTAGTTYTFRVRAVNGSNPSDYTPNASIVFGLPKAPTGINVVTLSTTKLRVSWHDQASNENGFRMERSTDGGATWPTVYSLGALPGTEGVFFYTNSGLTAATTYTYRVRAWNGMGNSAYLGPRDGTTQSAPADPDTLTATRNSSRSIKLTWIDRAANEQGFKLERSTDAGATWPVTLTLAGAVTGTGATRTYINTGLTGGVTYTYRVRAYNDTTYSGYSNTAFATP
jgi:hypothetical protein